MRNHERGIATIAFVLVLVFLVLAIFVFVTQMSDNDGLRAKAREAEAKLQEQVQLVTDYGRAYGRLIAGSQFELIERAGHYPHLEQPDLFAQKIVDFVARTQGGAA